MLRLILCCGLSGSGKSTYARELCSNDGWQQINRDSIRFSHYTKGV